MSTPSLLIVDDNAQNRELLAALLEEEGNQVRTASSGREALSMIARTEWDLILLDVRMPDLDGFAVLSHIRQQYPPQDLPVILVTALNDRGARLQAVEQGANDFIAKPVDPIELQVRTRSLLRLRAAQNALKAYQANLEEQVAQRTIALERTVAALHQANRHTEAAYQETIERLARAAEFKDRVTGQHLRRIRHYCRILALGLGLSPRQAERIGQASILHDIGKLGIPDAILCKPGPLTPQERRIIQTHTTIGAAILGETDSPLLSLAASIAATHHEHWDGSGYPEGLQGRAIPLEGRICGLADAFDALTSERSYKKAFSLDATLAILEAQRNHQFDPRLVDVLLKQRTALESVRRRFQDPFLSQPDSAIPADLEIAEEHQP